MSLRLGLGAKVRRWARSIYQGALKKPAFRALFRRNFNPRHEPGLRNLASMPPWITLRESCTRAGGRPLDRPPFRPSGIEAVAFDLLTALIDSWSLWIAVAGDQALGRAWRSASLRLVTAAGDYRPYEDIVRAAAAEMDRPPARAEALLDRWGELKPWPEVPGVLRALAGRRLAVVTNCSQSLAEQAAAATGASF